MLEARHGRDALTVAGEYAHPIDLLVTDVVMPEMGAGELAEQLRAQRPEMKVLFISGYTNDEVVRRGVKQKEAAFIQKPFTAEDLMRKVREVLEAEQRKRERRRRLTAYVSITAPWLADCGGRPDSAPLANTA